MTKTITLFLLSVLLCASPGFCCKGDADLEKIIQKLSGELSEQTLVKIEYEFQNLPQLTTYSPRRAVIKAGLKRLHDMLSLLRALIERRDEFKTSLLRKMNLFKEGENALNEEALMAMNDFVNLLSWHNENSYEKVIFTEIRPIFRTLLKNTIFQKKQEIVLKNSEDFEELINFFLKQYKLSKKILVLIESKAEFYYNQAEKITSFYSDIKDREKRLELEGNIDILLKIECVDAVIGLFKEAIRQEQRNLQVVKTHR